MDPIPSIEQLNTLFNGLGARPSSEQAEEALARFDTLAPTTQALAANINSQAGVDGFSSRVADLRKAILGTENQIEGVGESVLGRTSNSLVSQAQVNALTQKEQEPLLQLLSGQGRSLENAGIDLSDAQTRADRLLGFTRDDISTKRSSILDRLGLAQDREAQARAEADKQVQLQKFLDQFNAIGARIDALGQNIQSSRDRINAGIGSVNQTLQRTANARTLQPAATASQLGLTTANPQRVASGRTIQSGSSGLTLQGRGAISSQPLSVSRATPTRRITGVTQANPGTISGVVQPRSRFTITGVR